MRHKAEKMGRNRGQGIIIGFLVFVIAVISICTIIFRSYVREFHKVTEKEKYDQYYVMITEDRKTDFWQSVYRGAYERGQAENVYVDLLGEHLSQEYSRSDLMRIAMTSGVDGILVESDESDEMSELIDEAVDRGIPVVTLYGDNTHSARCSFVGVGSYNLGREYGRQVLKLAAAEDTEDPLKVAVLMNAHALNSAQNIVCSGIQDALEQEKLQGSEIQMSLITGDRTFLNYSGRYEYFFRGGIHPGYFYGPDSSGYYHLSERTEYDLCLPGCGGLQLCGRDRHSRIL